MPEKCEYCESLHSPIDLTNEKLLGFAKDNLGVNRIDALSRRLAVELFFHWYNSIKSGSKEENDLRLICRGAMMTAGSHHLDVDFTGDLMSIVECSLGEMHSHLLSWANEVLDKYPNIESKEAVEEKSE